MSDTNAKGANTATIIAAVITGIAGIMAAIITGFVTWNVAIKAQVNSNSGAADKQSISVQTLRFNGTNLELTPAQPQTFHIAPDDPEASREIVEVFEYVWVNVWEAGGQATSSNNVLARKANYAPGGSASVSLEGLAPGKYYCGFFGENEDSKVEVYLYYNPKQFFRWDGTKGEFL